MSALEKSGGHKVTVEGAKNIVARIKLTGDIRVTIDRVGSLARDGVVSADRSGAHASARPVEPRDREPDREGTRTRWYSQVDHPYTL